MSNRYTLFPIKYHNLWKFYKEQSATFWFNEEIPFNDDLVHWNSLNNDEKYFLKNILAFFASSDGIVNENLVVNFYDKIDIPEAKSFYAMQIAIENIHSECYSILIDTYIINTDEKNKLFDAINTIPIVAKKANWALKYIENLKNKSCYSKEFFTTLIAFICIEGIFFSGSFCAIYWLKNRGLLPALSVANQFISRDENLHTEFAIELFKTLDGFKYITRENIIEIFKSAVELEKEFICDSLKVSLIGMNSILMSQYIEYVADRWLVFLDCPKIYNSENPFNFMNMISINDKCNFFENQVSNYNKPNVGVLESEKILNFDDF